MTPEQKRTFNTGMGSLFLALGLGAWGLTAYYAKTPAVPKPAPILESTVDAGACIQTLAALGYRAQLKEGGALNVQKLGAVEDDIAAQLSSATVAATVCKMTMQSFCMGTACPEAGLSMVLVPDNQGASHATAGAGAAAASASSTPAAPPPGGKPGQVAKR